MEKRPHRYSGTSVSRRRVTHAVSYGLCVDRAKLLFTRVYYMRGIRVRPVFLWPVCQGVPRDMLAS